MTNDIKSKFIVSDSSTVDSITTLAEKAIKFGRVAENGRVIIDIGNLSQDEKIKLALTLRFIGGSLDSERIDKSISPKELTSILGESNQAVGSRLSVLSRTGFCKSEGHGKYVVYNYKIESFLDDLGSRDNSGAQMDSKTKRPRAKSGSRKEKALTGVGLHIQELITANFFKEPKFVSEIEKELVREGRYHDSRVIDSTIKSVFLLGRRSLKRIPNKEGGKAKWKYVNR